MMRWIVEPGLFRSSPVLHALIAGAAVSLLSSVTGFFVLLRRQAFAGHALTDVATTGGAAASLWGLAPLLGFLVGAFTGATALSVAGDERVRERDVATGVLLGIATGCSALFLYLTATSTANTGVAQQVLFGSVFDVSTATVTLLVIVSLALTGLTLGMTRPLMLSSLVPAIAAARGERTRLLSWFFMLVVAATVALSALITGSVLSTALLVGPAAGAQRLSAHPQRAIALAAALGAIATTLGVVLAYDSYYWRTSGTGLPVSFFIVMIVIAQYAISGLIYRARQKK